MVDWVPERSIRLQMPVRMSLLQGVLCLEQRTLQMLLQSCERPLRNGEARAPCDQDGCDAADMSGNDGCSTRLMKYNCPTTAAGLTTLEMHANNEEIMIPQPVVSRYAEVRLRVYNACYASLGNVTYGKFLTPGRTERQSG